LVRAVPNTHPHVQRRLDAACRIQIQLIVSTQQAPHHFEAIAFRGSTVVPIARPMGSSRWGLRCAALLVTVVILGLAGCGEEEYDVAGAGRLAAATGLGTDTPPGFSLNVVGATPQSSAGPALVPLPGQDTSMTGGNWILGKGGVGLSEETMIQFYTSRMMQHSLRHIRVFCTGPDKYLPDSQHSRLVQGWGSEGSTRFKIHVSWAGSTRDGWVLNQEIVTSPVLVKEYPARKVLEFRCRFVNEQLLLGLATTYGYTVTRITGDEWDPNIETRAVITTLRHRPYWER
jgi:hypothetical protein